MISDTVVVNPGCPPNSCSTVIVGTASSRLFVGGTVKILVAPGATCTTVLVIVTVVPTGPAMTVTTCGEGELEGMVMTVEELGGTVMVRMEGVEEDEDAGKEV